MAAHDPKSPHSDPLDGGGVGMRIVLWIFYVLGGAFCLAVCSQWEESGTAAMVLCAVSMFPWFVFNWVGARSQSTSRFKYFMGAVKDVADATFYGIVTVTFVILWLPWVLDLFTWSY